MNPASAAAPDAAPASAPSSSPARSCNSPRDPPATEEAGQLLHRPDVGRGDRRPGPGAASTGRSPRGACVHRWATAPDGTRGLAAPGVDVTPSRVTLSPRSKVTVPARVQVDRETAQPLFSQARPGPGCRWTRWPTSAGCGRRWAAGPRAPTGPPPGTSSGSGRRTSTCPRWRCNCSYLPMDAESVVTRRTDGGRFAATDTDKFSPHRRTNGSDPLSISSIPFDG